MGGRYDPLSSVIRQDEHTTSGHEFEKAMAEPIAAYCLSEGLDHKIVTDTREDWFDGTDFRVYSGLDMLTYNSGILRIDFTHDFDGKDNMPVTWDPTPGLMLRGRPLKFGIRTGNTVEGFKEPVVVIGVNMPREDVNATLSLIRREVKANAQSILYEAGEALAAYAYMTNPAYRVWLDDAKEHDPDIWVPDCSRLEPNYDGLASLRTAKRSNETINGMRLAMELAGNTMADSAAGSHQHERAAYFWRTVHKALDNTRPPAKTPTDPQVHVRQLHRAIRKMKDADKDISDEYPYRP